NKEISYVYSKEILSQLESVIPTSASIAIQEAIYMADIPALQKRLETFLLQTVSFHDAANETFYHGLVLGLCAMMDNRYHITSNREAGNGRFDIQMVPMHQKLPGILIELKAGKDCDDVQLEELAETALEQIRGRRYQVDMEARGIGVILKYGIAFSGKNVKIKVEN
ncbi:MAG: PD-(D/E)XK nuclease domain-containing protein, partial [Lachnospiraceae bacterium]|nr:PD-(D/E)XK nuclease domain-containing protein [Lachnospiraceae bacterium]